MFLALFSEGVYRARDKFAKARPPPQGGFFGDLLIDHGGYATRKDFAVDYNQAQYDRILADRGLSVTPLCGGAIASSCRTQMMDPSLYSLADRG